ncbi:MAG: hypothetical protein L6R38_003172 [Xanthoria sp. 2 TBL-2021]|nr:MAG: hypothetical protein L6R38_003172 [Xanthoria sp. 2 TBL-2021]
MGLAKHVVSIFHDGPHRPATYYITMDKLNKAILAQHKKNHTPPVKYKRKANDETATDDTAMGDSGSTEATTLDDTAIGDSGSTEATALDGAVNKRIHSTEPVVLDTPNTTCSPAVRSFRTLLPKSMPQPAVGLGIQAGNRNELIRNTWHRPPSTGERQATFHQPGRTWGVVPNEIVYLPRPIPTPIARPGIQAGNIREPVRNVWHRLPSTGERQATIHQPSRTRGVVPNEAVYLPKLTPQPAVSLGIPAGNVIQPVRNVWRPPPSTGERQILICQPGWRWDMAHKEALHTSARSAEPRSAEPTIGAGTPPSTVNGYRQFPYTPTSDPRWKGGMGAGKGKGPDLKVGHHPLPSTGERRATFRPLAGTGGVVPKEAVYPNVLSAEPNSAGTTNSAGTPLSTVNGLRIFPFTPNSEPGAEGGMEAGRGKGSDVKVWHRLPSVGESYPTIYRTVKVEAPDEAERARYETDTSIPAFDEDLRALQRGSQNHEDALKEQAKIRALVRHEHAVTVCWILQQGQRPKMLWECNVCDAKGRT